jgi:hypothetical protein
MTDTHPLSSLWLKMFALAGMVGGCFLVTKFSSITFFSQNFQLFQSLYLFPQFEQHFWQFVFSFLAIGFLSRGHLWSYGITSHKLKTSMQWLAGIYLFAILMTVIFWISGEQLSPITHDIHLHETKNSTMAMLIYWMASPVANQLLFFGLGQTVLMKQWGDSSKIFGVPIHVYISAAVFVLWSTNSSLMNGSYSVLLVIPLGIFCGLVYWKTGSLIAPMLGQAFYFGFPLFVMIVRLNFS